LAVEIASAIKSTGSALLPSDTDEKGNYKWSIKYADTKQARDISPFMDYLNYSNRQKLSALGIPSAILGEATFGQADAQADMLIVIIEDIVSQIEDVIQKDVVSQIVDYNFGPKHISKVKLRIDRSSLGRKKLFKEILVNMMRISASVGGDKPKNMPSIPGLCEDLGVPVELYSELFNEGVGQPQSSKTKSPLDEMIDNEDSNNIRRINQTDRSDKDRANSEGVID
jgi:hypothetical protein